MMTNLYYLQIGVKILAERLGMKKADASIRVELTYNAVVHLSVFHLQNWIIVAKAITYPSRRLQDLIECCNKYLGNRHNTCLGSVDNCMANQITERIVIQSQ